LIVNGSGRLQTGRVGYRRVGSEEKQESDPNLKRIGSNLSRVANQLRIEYEDPHCDRRREWVARKEVKVGGMHH